VSILGVNVGWLLSGSVVIETVYSLPGLGSTMISAILSRDYAVVQGITLVFGLLVLAVNLLTDVAYAALDPRVSYD
jgi:peptide/nickel transport system permease protein